MSNAFHLKLLAMALLSASLIGCGASDPEDSSRIQGAGSTFAQPLIKRWATQFREVDPAVVIDYSGGGSGAGEEAFLAGDVDFCATDAGLSDTQLAEVEGGAIQFPITAGAIVLAYNAQALPADLNLPREVYADVFLGREIRWNDPRIVAANPDAKLPSEAIQPVVRTDRSGTTFALTNHLYALSEAWREAYPVEENRGPQGLKRFTTPNAMSARGNEAVALLIHRTPYSLGYVQYGAALEAGLPMAALENAAGTFVKPSGTSGANTLANSSLPANLLAYFPDPQGESSYPLVTLTWMVLRNDYEDPQKAEQIRAFAKWCLTEGQALSESVGNVPLPEAYIGASQAALATP